jgi:HlyD family secretion protein
MKTRMILPSLLLACLVAGGGYYWWEQHRPLLLAGVAFGNGRTEADEIDIDTKRPGRIAEVVVDEVDVVKAGQLIARMDTQDQEATLGKDEALVLQARNTLDNRVANIAQQKTVVDLAKLELDLTIILVRRVTRPGSFPTSSSN